MSKNERNPWKWQQMSWTAYQFETSKNGLEFRNVEKQTEMSKNDQKCQKMTNSLRNYKKCLEILSNLKCQKNGLEFRNVEKRTEMSENVEEWHELLKVAKNL